jgi:hypothetical protein
LQSAIAAPALDRGGKSRSGRVPADRENRFCAISHLAFGPESLS